MAKIDVSDSKALRAAVGTYLDAFPGGLICALQLWYQCLDGQGVPNSGKIAAIQAAIADTPGWTDAGDVRDERYGVQKSYKRAAAGKIGTSGDKKIMVQHMFKKEGFYKEPDGTVLKIATSEAWNLRCFRFENGKLVGEMIRIHPESDRAKALVEVTP